jgi:hypothetical protein
MTKSSDVRKAVKKMEHGKCPTCGQRLPANSPLNHKEK